MIQKFMITIFMLSLLFTTSRAQVFVKQDATGNNDGSSWQDAFTNLEDALATAPMTDVWVASGTYTPGMINSNPDSIWFVMNTDISLYGGFAGTEDNFWDRDPAANPTILSGDLNGDDIPGDLVTNRSDNSIHVLLIEATTTNASIIDGFIISNGHGKDNPPGGEPDIWSFYHGAGILSYGAPTIRNCIFQENYSYTNSAVQGIGVNADGMQIDSCSFLNNTAQSYGGSVGMNVVDDFSITNCLFTGNSSGEHGGAIRIGVSNGTIFNCLITHNESEFGGGVALMNGFWDHYITIDQCTFEENESFLSGGALLIAGFAPDNLLEVEISNSTFLNNMADTTPLSGAGGAIAIQGYAYATVEESVFTENEAFAGGAIEFFFGGQGLVDNCLFENNIADEGGAVSVAFLTSSEDRISSVDIQQSVFNNNNATDNGGAVLVSLETSGTIAQCEFTGNESDIGGAIGFSGISDSGVEPYLRVDACTFRQNHGVIGGGAIDFTDANDVEISNSLFTENTGSGSAIRASGTSSDPSIAFIYNNTIVNNEEGINFGDNTTISLQNNILFNASGVNYIANGSPEVISNGGNLIHDLSMETVLADPSDIHNSDPLFVGTDDFHLTPESPCVDAGVSAGIVALYDLEGNDRIQGNNIDIGAIESPFVTATKDLVFTDENQLNIFPNPVSSILNYQLENDWKGNVLVEVINAQGQVVYSNRTSKYLEQFDQTLSVSSLPSGIYLLWISNGNKAVVKDWIKI